MIVFYKNYKRTDRTLLSIQSVRFLFPDIDIRCLFLYDETPTEYDEWVDKFEKFNVKLFFDKKTYNFGNSSAAGSSYNGYYFTEGINKIQKLSKEFQKVLIIDEDSFFTTGETIKFLLETNFDLAWANWPAPPNSGNHSIGINGSILSINPNKLNHLFPIKEEEAFIENLLGFELYDKCNELGYDVVKISTRDYDNYFGDGVHTNDIDVIKSELTNANISYE